MYAAASKPQLTTAMDQSDVVLSILKNLVDVRDVCRCALISRSWRALAEEEHVWKALCLKRWRCRKLTPPLLNCDKWKTVYHRLSVFCPSACSGWCEDKYTAEGNAYTMNLTLDAPNWTSLKSSQWVKLSGGIRWAYTNPIPSTLVKLGAEPLDWTNLRQDGSFRYERILTFTEWQKVEGSGPVHIPTRYFGWQVGPVLLGTFLPREIAPEILDLQDEHQACGTFIVWPQELQAPLPDDLPPTPHTTYIGFAITNFLVLNHATSCFKGYPYMGDISVWLESVGDVDADGSCELRLQLAMPTGSTDALMSEAQRALEATQWVKCTAVVTLHSSGELTPVLMDGTNAETQYPPGTMEDLQDVQQLNQLVQNFLLDAPPGFPPPATAAAMAHLLQEQLGQHGHLMQNPEAMHQVLVQLGQQLEQVAANINAGGQAEDAGGQAEDDAQSDSDGAESDEEESAADGPEQPAVAPDSTTQQLPDENGLLTMSPDQAAAFAATLALSHTVSEADEGPSTSAAAPGAGLRVGLELPNGFQDGQGASTSMPPAVVPKQQRVLEAGQGPLRLPSSFQDIPFTRVVTNARLNGRLDGGMLAGMIVHPTLGRGVFCASLKGMA